MIQLSQENREEILKNIEVGNIDSAGVSFPNFIDTILIKIKDMGLIDKISNSFEDKRKGNLKLPLSILIALAIAAKMKLKTALTDVPYAITDAEALSKFGWNIWDTERNLEDGLFAEGVMRNYIKKYESEEFIQYYNTYVNEEVLETLEERPNIHILDCTKIAVNLDNDNFENSEVIKIDGVVTRGYKLGTLRGLYKDTGIIEEITFGGIKTHDMELCRNMLKNTPHFKEGDILINDRGFICRDMINYLKILKGVDTYIPAKKNMIIHSEAVCLAKAEGKWTKHPNKKRKSQKIQLIRNLGSMWESDDTEHDVDICACVVWDEKDDEYYTFLTTDTQKTASQIISTYELRPEIEEDYRQIKDFWKLEDFKSTQYNFISFHIVMTLMGYLFYQIYTTTDEGSKFSGKSLPVIVKNYIVNKPKSIVIYVGCYFGIFTFFEFIQLYAGLDTSVRTQLDSVLKLL